MPKPVHLLAVRPHPDDESSATGGILAMHAALGHRTAVVTCTGGEEGEINDPDLVYGEAFPRLREIREAELRAACEVLGVAELRLLGYRDSGMADTEANKHLDAFCNVELDAAASRVAAIIRELRPATVVTENANGGYGHPDHVMCHRVAVRGWELSGDPSASALGEPWQPTRLYVLQYVTEGWDEIVALMRAEGLDTSEIETMMSRRRERVPDLDRSRLTAAIDVADYADVQRRALLCHKTQIRPDSFFMGLPSHIRRRAFATAYLQRLYPTPAPGERDEGLLA